MFNKNTVVFSLLLFCIIATDSSCSKNKAIPMQGNKLIGTWKNFERVKEQPVLIFKENYTYILQFLNGSDQYEGTYELNGDMIHIVDFYCGKVNPGIYRYEIKENKLTFKVVDDSRCDRNRFFPQDWQRQK